MTQADEPEVPIGTAEMMSDRSIILMLRAESAEGTIGETRFVYPMGSEGYEALIEHVGGLAPTQTKPVPPWPKSTPLSGGS